MRSGWFGCGIAGAPGVFDACLGAVAPPGDGVDREAEFRRDLAVGRLSPVVVANDLAIRGVEHFTDQLPHLPGDLPQLQAPVGRQHEIGSPEPQPQRQGVVAGDRFAPGSGGRHGIGGGCASDRRIERNRGMQIAALAAPAPVLGDPHPCRDAQKIGAERRLTAKAGQRTLRAEQEDLLHQIIDRIIAAQAPSAADPLPHAAGVARIKLVPRLPLRRRAGTASRQLQIGLVPAAPGTGHGRRAHGRPGAMSESRTTLPSAKADKSSRAEVSRRPRERKSMAGLLRPPGACRGGRGRAPVHRPARLFIEQDSPNSNPQPALEDRAVLDSSLGSVNALSYRLNNRSMRC